MVLQHQQSYGGNPPLSISSAPLEREDVSREIHSDIQNVLQLLEQGQELCVQAKNPVSHLCMEVERLTQGRACLQLEKRQMRRPSAAFSRTAMLSVQFGNVTYGMLCVYAEQQCYPLPALSRPVSQLLAQICGFLLHLFEQSAFLAVQYEHLDCSIAGPLTRREREVMELMYRGYREEEIAKELNISAMTVNKHRQNIYGQLGVHNEYDARLVAYHMRLFPLIEEHEQSRQPASLRS